MLLCTDLANLDTNFCMLAVTADSWQNGHFWHFSCHCQGLSCQLLKHSLTRLLLWFFAPENLIQKGGEGSIAGANSTQFHLYCWRIFHNNAWNLLIKQNAAQTSQLDLVQFLANQHTTYNTSIYCFQTFSTAIISELWFFKNKNLYRTEYEPKQKTLA